MSDIVLGDQAFNTRWRVRCDDEDFAFRLLTPEVQSLLAAWPAEYSVTIGAGSACVIFRRRFTPDRLAEMIALVTTLADALPLGDAASETPA